MTLPEQMIRAELLNSRITRTNAVYARFYGPLCLLVISLTFFPYYESEPDSSISYGNLWQEVVRLGPGYDLMALLVLLLTALLLALAAVGKLSTSGLIAILVGSTAVGSTLLQSRIRRPAALHGFRCLRHRPQFPHRWPGACARHPLVRSRAGVPTWRHLSYTPRFTPCESHCRSRPRSFNAGTTCSRVSGAN